jgi:PAS domain S-box-containing protein
MLKNSLCNKYFLSYQTYIFLIIITLSFLSGIASLGAESENIILQLAWKHQFQFAGYYAALHKGYYKKVGLDVTIIEGGEGRFAREELLEGRAQYGIAGSELLLHRKDGEPFVVLAPIFQHSPSILLVRRDSGIKNLQDLIGKKVMLLPGKKDADILASFLNEGISLDSIHRLDQSYNLNDLIEGRTDAVSAYLTNEPWLLSQQNVEPGIISTQTYGVDFYSDCLFTTENELENHPQRVAHFLSASLLGWEFAMAHPEVIIDILLHDYDVHKSRQHLRYEAESIRKIIMPRLVQIGHMNPGRWRHIARTYEKLDLIDANYQLNDFLYNPNDKIDYAWLKKIFLCAIALIFLLSMGTAFLIYFNRKLTIEVNHRKKVEEDLRTSEKEIQRTLDATADGIWSWNFKTNNLHFSPRYYEMLGYLPNEFQANFENWLNLVHPEDKDEALAVANDFLKTKPDLYENEFRLRTKSGDYRRVRTIAKVVERDVNGEAVYMIGNHEDITERKMAIDALIDEQKRFELAMQTVNDGLFDWNLKTNEIYYSPVWKKLLGYEDHEIKNEFSEWERLTDTDDVKASWKIMNEVIDGKRSSFESEFKMLHKDGHWVDILSRANVFFDENGKGFRVIGTHVDITERKRTEKHLQHSQKMEAIGTLAGGIAHDFNNMLGIITGNLSFILSNMNKEDELYEILSDMQESSKQAQGLTNQLLTFSKGGAPVKKVTDINNIVRNAARFCTRGTQSKCIFELSDNLWPSEVDEGQINQVVNNMVINANQAMPNGGQIKIRTENIHIKTGTDIPLQAGPYINIIFKDQGTGISQIHLSHIFDPFFSTRQKGSGLGLATTYSIIKRHNGHITVDSEIDKGTIFNVYLPASTKEFNVHEKPIDSKHHGNGKILIMDDQEAILKMVQRMLKLMGYQTACALNGTQAVEMYKNAHDANDSFDAVILDLTVPGGMGGLQTITELLKINPEIKAIVSSGYSNDPIMSDYEDHGFRGVVPKPYSKMQLAEVLNDVLGVIHKNSNITVNNNIS